jgi:thiamine biosynthesis lipoprotein
VYKITYQYAEDLQADIKAELEKVNASLSPFQKHSIISRINGNDPAVLPDSLFLHVFQLARAISADTHGAFDITVAPLVNAWGFGFESIQGVDSLTIDSLCQYVGMSNVYYDGEQIIKTDSCVKLDCSAIAKGYGCDVVAALFNSKGIRNYMIEIGGEIVVKGINAKRNRWSIGINKPVDDSLALASELQTILHVSDIAMATSGNYRNFYYRDGKKVAHTIDPRTGYPVQHSILSATVLAPDCATADAYATSFMVLGLDSAMAICNRHPELQGYFIYADEQGQFATSYSQGFERWLKK